MRMKLCRFNNRKECVFEDISEAPKSYIKAYGNIYLVYDQRATFVSPVKYDDIMKYPKYHMVLPKIKNIINQRVSRDPVAKPKVYKHIIDYTYEKK